MTSTLRTASLAALATLLSLGSSQGALADGRGDWKGYAWQQIKLVSCTASGSVLQCPPYREKWDWKRNQWVDVVIQLDLGRGELRLTQRLVNSDPSDEDDICVTALAMDADGGNIVAHHQNWHMIPRTEKDSSFLYASSALDQVTTIHIGSKQCRQGPHQDDALYARVLAGISS